MTRSTSRLFADERVVAGVGAHVHRVRLRRLGDRLDVGHGPLLPAAIEGLAGVTAMEMSAAAVTVRFVQPSTPVATSMALIVVVPGAALVPRPSEPATLLTVATPVSDDIQVTCVERSCIVPSVKVPMAVN